MKVRRSRTAGCVPLTCLVMCVVGALPGCSDRSRLQTFHFGKGNCIVLYASTEWEVSQDLLYEAYSGTRLVVPLTAFYYHDPEKPLPRFRLVGDATVAGIVADTLPNKLLVIFDASSGQSWPYQGLRETGAAFQAKRRGLLAAINAQSKQNAFSAVGP